MGPEGRFLRTYDSACLGQGGFIPLCNTLGASFPDAELIFLGVEEPCCLVHAPNECVDPAEIERMALAETLFPHHYADRAGDRPGPSAGVRPARPVPRSASRVAWRALQAGVPFAGPVVSAVGLVGRVCEPAAAAAA